MFSFPLSSKDLRIENGLTPIISDSSRRCDEWGCGWQSKTARGILKLFLCLCIGFSRLMTLMLLVTIDRSQFNVKGCYHWRAKLSVLTGETFIFLCS